MKCTTNDGPIVVKVFVIHDPLLYAEAQKKQLQLREVAARLAHASNCLPYNIVEVGLLLVTNGFPQLWLI